MVKCADCGFLTLRNRFTPGLDEAERSFRETGEVSRIPNPQLQRSQTSSVIGFGVSTEVPLHEPEPACFARKLNMRGIIEQAEGNDGRLKAILEILRTERDCNGHVDWVQGFTPKEHQEMLDKRWERKWRIIELVVLGIIAVLVAGGFTILGAFIERGSIP